MRRKRNLSGWLAIVGFGLFAAGLVGTGPVETATSLRADGLIYQLPEDGTWVRYKTTMTFSSGGKVGEVTGRVTISSVGKRVTEDQGPCRWIEVASELSDGKAKQVSVGKFLIPETALVKGHNPRNFIVKAWGKDGAGVKEEGELPEDVGSMLDMLFHGPLDNSKPISEATVKTKLGELKAAGVSGTRTRKLGSDTETMQLTVAARNHEKVPFGVLDYATKYTVKGGAAAQEGTMRLIYEDSGDKAVTKLPEQD
jgi:hypothetical protein